MSPSPRLLTGPYGWDSCHYASVILRAAAPVDALALTSVLLRYSCYRPAIGRIQACLLSAGMYPCYLQYGWFRQQWRECQADLAAIGVTLEIQHWHHGGRDLSHADFLQSRGGC